MKTIHPSEKIQAKKKDETAIVTAGKYPQKALHVFRWLGGSVVEKAHEEPMIQWIASMMKINLSIGLHTSCFD